MGNNSSKLDAASGLAAATAAVFCSILGMGTTAAIYGIYIYCSARGGSSGRADGPDGRHVATALATYGSIPVVQAAGSESFKKNYYDDELNDHKFESFWNSDIISDINPLILVE